MPTMTSADAKTLARLQHSGQLDKAGHPYIEHVERVAYASERRAERARDAGLTVDIEAIAQAAWLHDVVEDTPVTAEDLRADGYSEPVVAMVELLTKSVTRATYEERIAKIIASSNLGAILIKWSDNEDNANPNRPLSPESTLPARYAASIARLRKGAEALGYVEP